MGAPFPIVGIGASAGGVEALEAFFGAMPRDNGMAFVVITHLDPNRESWLADILGRCTTMPVAAARDGDEVKAQQVYVLPPGVILTIEQGHLRLRARGTEHSDRAPIDIFFSSLAEDRTEAAVGIVLSGAGSDGTLGIKAIKEHGGLTLAQASDRTKPRFKEMPESAAATGLVDLEVPVERMPEQLLRYVQSASQIDENRIAAATKRIHDVLRSRVGHDFSKYKGKTFGRRVQRRMQVLQLHDIDGYVQRLQNDAEEAGLLFRDLLIGVTNFFRDPAAFRALESSVIPELFEDMGADNEVRVWVPGCASGEEVYSIAILLAEHAATLRFAPRIRIFASDIDEHALATARAGRYTASLLMDVSPERLERFFVSEGQGYRIAKELRDLCVFSTHSVIRDPPFSRVDLISCRNLLIYLHAELQAQLFPMFHYALRPTGFLFLGLSETTARHGDLFTPIDKEHRIFKRRDSVAQSPGELAQFRPRSRQDAVAMRRSQQSGALKPGILRHATAAVTEKYAPAHVVVNEQGEVLHYSIRTGKYLEPAFGPPNRDLLAMTRKGLRLDLRAALRAAIETGRSVTRDKVSVEIDGGVETVSVTVEPVTAGNEAAFLVVFNDLGPMRSREEAPHDGSPRAGDDDAIQQLETELREIKERLQSAIEELESSNEELKSSNEELMSVNEEIQSSNEELVTAKEEEQSINEELQTLNAELHRKVEDLDRAHSDLRNLFESTQVATMFLDRDMVIRSFTPAITDVFGVTPADRGRPLANFTSRLDDQNLAPEIHRVFERQEPIERRVTAGAGATHYLMRILPYRAVDNTVEGVLLTFTSITGIIHAEEHQKLLSEELSHRVKNTLTIVASIATQTAARSSNVDAFLSAYLGRVHALAFAQDLLSQRKWADAPLSALIKAELAPYVDVGSGRVRIAGPAASVKPRAALTLGMVLHEHATNSVKYGALSAPEGRIEVTWRAEDHGLTRRLELSWVESGGPALFGPVKRGFGTEFVERAVAFELGGETKLVFDRAGARSTITVPMDPEIVLSPGS